MTSVMEQPTDATVADLAIVPTPTPEAETKAAARVARLNAAKAEAAAVKADPTVPTPNLTAIKEHRPIMGTDTKTKAGPTPGAATAANHRSFPLRSKTHAEKISEAIKGLSSYVEDLTLLVKRGEQDQVVEALAKALDAASGNQFNSRVLTIAYVAVRHDFPGSPPVSTSQTARLVSALNDAVKTGQVVSWDAAPVADSTLRYTVEASTGKTEGLRTRDGLALVDHLIGKTDTPPAARPSTPKTPRTPRTVTGKTPVAAKPKAAAKKATAIKQRVAAHKG